MIPQIKRNNNNQLNLLSYYYNIVYYYTWLHRSACRFTCNCELSTKPKINAQNLLCLRNETPTIAIKFQMVVIHTNAFSYHLIRFPFIFFLPFQCIWIKNLTHTSHKNHYYFMSVLFIVVVAYYGNRVIVNSPYVILCLLVGNFF